ncbi:acyl transferase/acyl hydrolase/lysophospholipase [Neohortaea acidophila]|uniref:Patatin-like phospholipase domain-containing protein n=1 Tax=Neohortaea acidophila TaxID=245834 RepID=A0A6A6PWR3_9PEZI|nr:acyl transferase/acyl hydrolase/lysophospholipase [Neohortaea acidophila]KAF2483923.1 acyl transferase/acyl hydrolase/lysophospholipase [Neohortaea acidophila]
MDLPYIYTIFHNSNGAPKSGLLWHSVAQLGADTLDALGSVVQKLQNERLARRTRLLQQLADATSWAAYSDTCAELDELEGAAVWKEQEPSEYYDVGCLRGRLKRLALASEQDDLAEMLHIIRGELTRDLGGVCNPALHRHTRAGTKFLIDHYIATVRQALARIVDACALGDPRLRELDVELELEQTRRSYGRTALLLSGGGTLGMSHIGVIKALHEAKALPRIISGSSSGSIVAAVLGCTPDEDLVGKLYDFCNGDLAVFVGPHERQGWGGRVLHFGANGYFFELGNLRRVMVDLLGKTTFLEAYNRTRRVLNITVSNSSSFESQGVLNYATAGNVAIWSAVVASCAVPLGFEPERLLFKCDGERQDLTPWDPTTKYVDGSINGDLPTSILSAEFDVNHTIASQVNPHVVPFLNYSTTPAKAENTPYWISAVSLAHEEAIRSMDILSGLPCLQRKSNLLSKVTSVLSQRYSGDITLYPVDGVARFWKIMKNPTPRFMQDATERGEKATWPVLSMIKAHMDIELLIDDAVRKVSEHVSFSQSVSDLRRLQYKGRAGSQPRGGRVRNGEPRGSTLFQLPRDVSPADSVTVVAGDGVSISPASTPEAHDSDEDSMDDEAQAQSKAAYTKTSWNGSQFNLSASQSLPNTPIGIRHNPLDNPGPSSPARAPASLLMTPIVSPETSPKASRVNLRIDLNARRRADTLPPTRDMSPAERRKPT